MKHSGIDREGGIHGLEFYTAVKNICVQLAVFGVLATTKRQPMIAIEKLCYVRLSVADLRKTADFATRIIGLEPVESADDTAMFRSDYRDHTLVLYQSDVPEQTVAIESTLRRLGHRRPAASRGGLRCHGG